MCKCVCVCVCDCLSLCVCVCVCVRAIVCHCAHVCLRLFRVANAKRTEEFFLSAGKDVSFKMMIWQQQQHCLSQKPSQTLFPPSFRLDAFSSKQKKILFSFLLKPRSLFHQPVSIVSKKLRKWKEQKWSRFVPGLPKRRGIWIKTFFTPAHIWLQFLLGGWGVDADALKS